MCRMVVFAGSCTRCGDSHTWEDLTQRLSCLEAKNNDAFGSCTGGVFEEQHDFDQECDRCAEEDEGIGDIDDEENALPEPVTGKRAAVDDDSDGEGEGEGDGADWSVRDAKKQKT